MDESRRKYITQQFTFKDYFGPKKGANCILAWDNVDKKWDWWPHNGCHGALSANLRLDRHTEVYSTLWCRHEELYEAACEYWDYLLSPTESPFRQSLKGLERFYDEKGRPIAFGYTNLDVPAQIAVPLMMQCRVPQEHSHKLRSWAWWRKSGFTKAESLWLSEHYRLHLDGTLSSLEKEGYRHAFCPKHGINMEALITGVPKATLTGNTLLKRVDPYGMHYVNRLEYAPVNAVWSAGTSNKFSKLDAMLKGENKYAGAFPLMYAKETPSMEVKGHGFCDKVNAARILMEQRKVWSAEKHVT
jgi:hypothetical protein